jgi:diphthamide synthase (EF-2-diphthine--ammonia ligase)
MNQELRHEGFTHAVSGDLFLEDLKTYREQLYGKDDLHCLFPLWKTDTKELIRSFFSLRFKAIIVCVNSSYLERSFCGRLLDEAFVDDLPARADVCGENGEYHSFVFEGPVFWEPIEFTKGEVVFKEYAGPKKEEECFTAPQPPSGFYFCDLLP